MQERCSRKHIDGACGTAYGKNVERKDLAETAEAFRSIDLTWSVFPAIQYLFRRIVGP